MMIFAHRGARAYAPENTLAAFEKAAELAADGIELDVQATKDGVVVVCHDHSVNRTSNGKGWIKDLTLSELKRLDFGGWFSQEFQGEPILTLDEFLTWFANTTMLLNIELKNGPVVYPKLEAKVVDSVQRFALTDRVIISSFYHPSLVKIKELCPTQKTGALFGCRPCNPLAFCHETGADYLHPSWDSLDAAWVRAARTAGIKVNTYTVNHRDQFEFVSDIGVDAIFSDCPDIWR